MNTLKLGFMTTTDLANWANKSSTTLTSRKKAWCEKFLSSYADYELARGGVIIKKIYEPCFQSSGRQEVKNKYEQFFGHNEVYVDSSKNCWLKLKPNLTNKLKDNTGTSYVGLARREDYGCAAKSKQSEGPKGTCKYVFGKIINNEFEWFTTSELKIKEELEQKYFNESKDTVYDLKILNEAFREGEINEEEYIHEVDNLTNNKLQWGAFQAELEERIGAQVEFRIMIKPKNQIDRPHENVLRPPAQEIF